MSKSKTNLRPYLDMKSETKNYICEKCTVDIVLFVAYLTSISASNYWAIFEWWIRKDLKWNDIPLFACRDWVKPRTTWIRIFSVPALDSCWAPLECTTRTLIWIALLGDNTVEGTVILYLVKPVFCDVIVRSKSERNEKKEKNEITRTVFWG